MSGESLLTRLLKVALHGSKALPRQGGRKLG